MQRWSAEYSALICGFSEKSRVVMASYVASHGWRGWLRRKGKLWAATREVGGRGFLVHVWLLVMQVGHLHSATKGHDGVCCSMNE